MKVLTPDNQVECARVYVDNRNRSVFTVKCYYCCREFHHWMRFVAHIEARHSDLERAYLRAKDAWAQHQQPKYVDCDDAATESGTEFELQQTSQPSEPVLQETELVLISVEPNLEVEEKSESECEDVEYMDEEEEELEVSLELKDQQQVTDFQVERMPVEFVNTELRDSEMEADGELELSVHKRRHSANGMQSEADENGASTAQQVTGQKVKRRKSAQIGDVTQTHSKAENGHKSEPPEQFDEMQLPVTARYLQLRTTKPSIMSAFIEIMRRHPCQWNPQHPDYEIKDRRDESAEQMCNELQERIKIDITPQVARASVCYLRRWYAREYLRLQSSKQAKRQRQKQGSTAKVRGVYACSHPEYYKQLAEFLPRNHLVLRTCDKCPRKFKTDQQLQSHQYHMHGGELPYRCEHCGRCFLYQSTLRHHENRHTRERIWQCKQCDYSCTTKTDYGLHMVTHTDIRAYVCELCGAAYKSSASLSVHRRSHGPPSLECGLCGKKFYENYHLRKHMWKHEGDSAADAAVAEHEAELLAESSMEAEEPNHTKVRKASTLASINSLSEEQNLESELSLSGSEDNAVDNEATVFGCTLCERDFDNLNALRTHGLRQHNVFIF